MKSSTIRRSTLSKESMEVIEALSKEQENDGSIGEYIRPEEVETAKDKENDYSKTQEIDLLWQNFKATQFNSNSPTAYILMGFAAGVILTLLILFCIGWFSNGKAYSNLFTKPAAPVEQPQVIEEETSEVQNTEEETPAAVEEQQPEAQETKPEQKTEESKPTNVKMKKYIVKSGDTGESIIKHFYGSYSPEYADKIMQANDLKNLDRINIDQVLLIPIEK